MPKQLPDTPWHVGSPKMKESDHRRLNKWCVHYEASICREPRSGCYMVRCGGSSHCKFYSEDEISAKKLEYDNRTQEEIDTDNRRRYIETLRPKMQALISSSDGRRYTVVESLKNCYICGSKLLEMGKHRKQCSLCCMEYVDQNGVSSEDLKKSDKYVYVMGYPQPQKELSQAENEPCQFRNYVGRCQDISCQLYRKQCKPRYCANLKKKQSMNNHISALHFSGTKNIPINKIILPAITQPKQSRIDSAAKYIRDNGTIERPIYVEIVKDKYVIKDGFIRYLAAVQCGLAEIPATLERKK